MRVLWFVPTCPQSVREKLGLQSSQNGWWVENLLYVLKRTSGIELGIAWSSREINYKEKFNKDGLCYYCIPESYRLIKMMGKFGRLLELLFPYQLSTSHLVNACVELVTDFKPDIIHIHGSERPYGLIAEKVDIPVVLSIQGILYKISEIYFGCLPLVSRLGIPHLLIDYLSLLRKAGVEKRIFEAISFFMGRTDWDHKQQESLNSHGIYFHCGEIIRPEFYNIRWDVNTTTPHVIYTTTSCLPYKGLDTLLDAIVSLSRLFPSVKLNIGGEIPERGYGNFLRQRVKTMGLENCVRFLGRLDAERIARELFRAQVFVLPSYIENSSNSLAEAQIVGTPVVASCTGGIPSMVINGHSGLLFPPGDAAVLAMKIQLFFEDSNLAEYCSEQARKISHSRHNEEVVAASVLRVYDEIKNSTVVLKL